MQELTIDLDIINKMAPFDFIKVFMTDKTTYKKLTNKAKLEHRFMLYRTLAIAYPTVINEFNKIFGLHETFDSAGIHVPIMDALHARLCVDNGRQPGWMFTKAEPPKKFVGVLSEYEPAVIKMFQSVTGWENKSLKWMNNNDPVNLKAQLDEFKDALDNKIVKRKSTAKKTEKPVKEPKTKTTTPRKKKAS